jgi:hypothetical protein
MQSQSEIASPPPGGLLSRLLPPALVVTAIVGAWVLFAVFIIPAEPVRALDARCEPWDDAASAAIARLIVLRNETAEAFLGDAVFRLRRARRNCRAGWVDLSRRDYDALSEGRIGNRYRLHRSSRAETSPRASD